jgi:hypothetical protein
MFTQGIPTCYDGLLMRMSSNEEKRLRRAIGKPMAMALRYCTPGDNWPSSAAAVSVDDLQVKQVRGRRTQPYPEHSSARISASSHLI